MWEKFKRLTSEAWQECSTQPKLLYCFACCFSSRLITVLFSVYLQLWIMSFKESGVIESTELADRVYMRITAAAVVSLVFFAPLYGLYSDVADPKKMITLSFLIRGLLAACFKFVQDPNTWQGYLLGVSIIIVSAAQFISVESYLMYRVKKTIRGTLMGFAMFAGSIGMTTFAIVGGIIFDRIGPWAPFVLVALIDGLVVIISLAFIYCGLLDSRE